MWWMALAAACEIETVVAGFPIGPVPDDARFHTVLKTDCEPEQITGMVRLTRDGLPLDQLSVSIEAEDGFVFLSWSREVTPGRETVYEVEVRIDDEPDRFLGGIYEVDPTLQGALLVDPALGDVVIERRGEGVSGSAAVLPASNGPEALLLWYGDGQLREVTVSTQGSPDVGWVPEDFTDVCLRVEEIGLSGTRAATADRCVDLEEPTGCGCSSSSPPLVLPLLLPLLLLWIRRRDSQPGIAKGCS